MKTSSWQDEAQTCSLFNFKENERMLKMKNILPVFVVLMFLGVASTAFGQMACSVSSVPVATAVVTGLTEPAGDVTFNCTQTSATGSSAATVTVSYGVNITNTIAWPTAKPVSIAGNTCVLGGSGAYSVAVSNIPGAVVITTPPLTAGGVNGVCSFTLTGVLLQISGAKTLGQSVPISISVSPGNNLSITAGQTAPNVVNSVVNGLAPTAATATVPTGGTPALTLLTGPGQILTSSGVAPVSAAFSINVTESTIGVFQSATQFNGGANTNSVELAFTFKGIPVGSSLTGCTVAETGTGATGVPQFVSSASSGPITIGATSTVPNPTVLVNFTGTVNISVVEGVTLACSGFSVGTATLPLAAGNVTANVTLAPTGQAFATSTNAPLVTVATGGSIPRYTSLLSADVVVETIISATTHMLFPFVSIGSGFDTGFVVTNTTADPYGPAGGGARPLTGPVTMVFFPAFGLNGTLPTTIPSPFCLATGAGAAGTSGQTPINGVSAGCTVMSLSGKGTTGLNGSGAVAAGDSWVALGSEMFSQLGSVAPASFTGYVFGIANFPFAHPTAFVADATFSGKFSSGGPALVLPNPTVISRTGGAFAVSLVESLGH
jgi:hypothetical protein